MTLLFKTSKSGRQVLGREPIALELLEDRWVLSHAGLLTAVNLDVTVGTNPVAQSEIRTLATSSLVEALPAATAQVQTEISLTAGVNPENVASSAVTHLASVATVTANVAAPTVGEVVAVVKFGGEVQAAPGRVVVDVGTKTGEALPPASIPPSSPVPLPSSSPPVDQGTPPPTHQPGNEIPLPGNSGTSTPVSSGNPEQAAAAPVASRSDASSATNFQSPNTPIQFTLTAVPPNTPALDVQPRQDVQNILYNVNEAAIRNVGRTEIGLARPAPITVTPTFGDEWLDDGLDEWFEDPAATWTPQNNPASPGAAVQPADLFAAPSPVDFSRLEAALRDFLDNIESDVLQLVQPEATGKWISWIVVGVITGAAFAIARRRAVRTRHPMLLANTTKERLAGLKYRPRPSNDA